METPVTQTPEAALIADLAEVLKAAKTRFRDYEDHHQGKITALDERRELIHERAKTVEGPKTRAGFAAEAEIVRDQLAGIFDQRKVAAYKVGREQQVAEILEKALGWIEAWKTGSPES